ncbi:glutamate 5-kinase [Camelimonas sp. ID_303_24]
MTEIPALDRFRRIVVKVGSSLLVDRERGAVRQQWLSALADDLAALHQAGKDVMVVSSGSISLGRAVLKLPQGPLRLEESQAAASVGQIALARTWSEALGARGVIAGQVLVTLWDTEERRRYLNARATVGKLLEWRAIPVINENDTVATSEIRYGDNDRLAARVATMADADLLVLLSDIDGLYTAPPGSDPSAKHIPVVPRITAEIEAMAGGAASQFSRGGMRTKIEAGKIATHGGAHMIIASGLVEHPLRRIAEGGPATWFLSRSTPARARKKWIGGLLETSGAVTIDDGAVAALRRGKSLLPAGVTAVEGEFLRGDPVLVRNPAGAVVARGLINFDADDARAIAGHGSGEIAAIVGYAGRAEMIHRDVLVLTAAAKDDAA